MSKKLFFISILAFVVVGLLSFGSPAKTSADSADNLAKASVGILGGWSEVAIYPTQEAAKPGLRGKILFPINIGVGAFKAIMREFGGAVDFLTFFKGKNIVNSYPGEEL